MTSFVCGYTLIKDIFVFILKIDLLLSQFHLLVGAWHLQLAMDSQGLWGKI